MRFLFTILMISAGLSSCHTATYVFDDSERASYSKGEKIHHNFAFGLYEYDKLDLQKECPNGVVKVKCEKGPMSIGIGLLLGSADSLLGLGGLAGSIYTPWSVTVDCYE